MGSPSLSLSQRPPKPCQRVFPLAGPSTSAPVVLLNTAKEVLTHCTYWVDPTAPTVSGGALLGLKPARPTPTPSKLRPAVPPTLLTPPRRCSAASPLDWRSTIG